jgi:polysaccharide export outer membrane protein
MKNMSLRSAVGAAVCVVVVACSGCQSLPSPTRIGQADAEPPPVFVLPGDELEITFFGAPDLSTIQKVRRDGMISLKLVDPVQAAGLTTEDLERKLAKLYEEQLQIKAISVTVRNPAKILVTGSVLNPGPIEMDRPMTVLEAVMESGGFDEKSAEVRSVVVIRHDGGQRTGYVFDFKSALSGGGADKSFYLRPHDIVYVPRTGISRANQAISQYIEGMIPDLGVGYNSDGTVTVYQ